MTITAAKMRLEGKSILTTAAGQGIGLAPACAENGAEVYVTDFNSELLAQITYPNIHTHELDVTGAASVLAGVQWAQSICFSTAPAAWTAAAVSRPLTQSLIKPSTLISAARGAASTPRCRARLSAVRAPS